MSFTRAPLRGPILCLALLACSSAAAGPPSGEELRVERVVLFMRHGVRSPTKSPPAPPGIAAEPWPQWSVPPGWLTEHGARGVRLLAQFDRHWLVQAKVLPSRGCPSPGSVSLHSDSDERTIVTGDDWLASVAPGCTRLTNEHVPQGEPDPLFAHEKGGASLDPARASAAAADALGAQGIQGVLASRREALATLDRILCGSKKADCGLAGRRSTLIPATARRGPRLSGALALASTLSQVLVLEYADGLPLAQVGWGRATAQDIQIVGVLHSTHFSIENRPLYLAVRRVKPIAQRILVALDAADAPSLVALIGHDGQVASLGGLLGLHWQVPGYAADDPPPGGALVFERLRDAHGERFVRVRFRAQSLQQARELSPLERSAPYFATLSIAGCGTLCPLKQFQEILAGQLARGG